MLRRFSEGFLASCLSQPRRKPLVLRGARQVRKSTLTRQFASHQGLTLIEINLERNLGQDAVFKTLEVGVILYWVRQARSGNAEVDYVSSCGDWIFPMEVKAGRTGASRSSQQFVLQKHPPVAVRFDLNVASCQHVKHATRTAGETCEVA